MDLSSGYRSIARRCFPNAKIVADRFHVIRLVLYSRLHAQTVSPFGSFACGKISFALRLNCKSAQEDIKWNRKISYPLRKRKDRLKPQDKERLKSFFKENPAMKLAYEFKERLCELLNKKSQTAKQCRDNIKKLKEMMKVVGYDAPIEFGELAETISENGSRQ